jgi:hypothetical protein
MEIPHVTLLPSSKRLHSYGKWHRSWWFMSVGELLISHIILGWLSHTLVLFIFNWQSLLHMALWPDCCRKCHWDTIGLYSCTYRVWHSHCSSFPMVIGHRRGNSTFFIGKSSTNSIAIFIDRRALPIHISVFVVFVGEIPLSHLKKKTH